ncbi:hypothetical protein [Saccharothrix deserti]|uniref:hypothetical protein n=1 Tax=Saccharothrix deserti TaxID=2593674 RepID=UPI00131E9F2D|nr:hypothetical protein [Saccharothrix deserti]
MITSPTELPDLRLRMREHVMTSKWGHEIVHRLDEGKAALTPRLTGPPRIRRASTVTGALLMARREEQRLGEAQLYWVDQDMSTLALAAAATPSREPVMARRMPAESGLMVFCEPIGGRGGEQVVAVSWSHWTPQDLGLEDGSGLLTWSLNTLGGAVPLHPGFDGVWLTYWTPQLVPLAESVLPFGQPLPLPRPDTAEQWAHVVYTSWQLMAQTGNARLAALEELTRTRHGRKRDQRADIEDSSAVRLVRVHTRQRAIAPAGHDAPQWTSRWPVRPYRRNTCLNSRLHADGGCEHEERIVPAHIKGPADKPLKVNTRVNVWDSPPPTKS